MKIIKGNNVDKALLTLGLCPLASSPYKSGFFLKKVSCHQSPINQKLIVKATNTSKLKDCIYNLIVIHIISLKVTGLTPQYKLKIKKIVSHFVIPSKKKKKKAFCEVPNQIVF